MKRIVLALFRLVLPADWADDIARDLEEAHGRSAAGRGRVRADVWLAGQWVLFTVRFGLERLRERFSRAGPREIGVSLAQDVRLTFRFIRSSPAFYGAIVLTLAVGIGANTAIFSVVRMVVLEPLPYPAPGRLVVMEPYPWTPARIVDDVRRSGGAFEALEGFYPLRFTVTGGERPVEMEGAVVTPGFLRLLGAETALGRRFVEADARPDAPRTAILSYGAWQDHFGGSLDLIGRSIRLDGAPYEIVGVVRAGFRQLTPRTGEPEVWTAAGMDRLGEDVLPDGSIGWAIPVGRLAEGVPLERAQSELDAALARFREREPDLTDGPVSELRWTTLRSNLTGGVRGTLLILQTAVGVLLLLACVNVANLLLVRFGSRRGEMAIRTAVGASRGRLLRQLLTESIVLALLGGVAGLVLMAATLELVLALAPRDIPRISEVSVDGTAFLFTLVVAMATGVLFGVVPGLTATRKPPHRSLKGGGRTTTGSRGAHRLSQALVVAEVTLTLMLLTGAGLLMRSFVSLSEQEPGFRSTGVLAMRMSVPENRYESVPLLEDYQRRLVERLREVPGVESAALTNNVPIQRGNATRSYVVEGEIEPRGAQYGVVSPEYFRTLGIPLLRGRPFDDSDRRAAPRVTIVDEALARQAWPRQDPIGQRMRFEDDAEWFTVVGLSADIRGSGLAAAPGPGFYISYRQRLDTPVELAVGRDIVLLVRTVGGAGGLAVSLRRAVWDVDPGQPVPEITRLTSVLVESTAPQRFRAMLFAAFAAVALILAVAGIYGVVGHLLEQRSHELGIRRALGATAGDVVRMVLFWGLRLTVVGVALGLAGVAWTGRFLAGLLFGVGSTDAATILAAVATVLLIAIAACVVPAHRATRIDARTTLRSE